jgi:hypothetical protein
LSAADEEIERWQELAERTWLERHDGTIGLVIGIIAGGAVAVGIAAAVDKVVNP